MKKEVTALSLALAKFVNRIDIIGLPAIGGLRTFYPHMS